MAKRRALLRGTRWRPGRLGARRGRLRLRREPKFARRASCAIGQLLSWPRTHLRIIVVAHLFVVLQLRSLSFSLLASFAPIARPQWAEIRLASIESAKCVFISSCLKMGLTFAPPKLYPALALLLLLLLLSCACLQPSSAVADENNKQAQGRHLGGGHLEKRQDDDSRQQDNGAELELELQIEEQHQHPPAAAFRRRLARPRRRPRVRSRRAQQENSFALHQRHAMGSTHRPNNHHHHHHHQGESDSKKTSVRPPAASSQRRRPFNYLFAVRAD